MIVSTIMVSFGWEINRLSSVAHHEKNFEKEGS